MGRFGEELRRAREFKSLTLEDIQRITKINLKTLTALEEERFEILPAPYVRAFIKAYVGAVGMNLDKVMSEYDALVKEAESEGERDEIEPQLEETQPEYAAKISELWRDYGNYALYGLSGILAVIVILVIVFSTGNKKSAVPEETGMTTSLPASGLNLTVSADTSLYLMVSIDGGDSLDYYLGMDASRDFRAEERIWILTDNAGAVKLSLNGRSLGEIGGVKVPAHFAIESSGLGEVKTFKSIAQIR